MCSFFRSFLFGIACLLVLAGGAQARGNFPEVDVVPAPGAVTVDGNLADWDSSCFVDTFYDETLLPNFTARVGFMYDKNAFYLAAHMVDATPMMNAQDPKLSGAEGWRGDALQVRIVSDPRAPSPLPREFDRTCHLTMWYFTAGNLPCLTLQYGMDYHGITMLTGKESGLVFKKDADGKGYTIEGRIPWRLLHAADNPPKAGDKCTLTIQPLWGDARGENVTVCYFEIVKSQAFAYQSSDCWGKALFSATGKVTPRKAAGAAFSATPLTFTLNLPDDKATTISAAVFSPDAGLVRTLTPIVRTADAARKTAEIRWDGLDDLGNPLAPGKYTVKLLTHRGVGQQFVSSIHNAGTPPWQIDDGTGAWGGGCSPASMAVAAGGKVVLGWSWSEGGAALVAVKEALAPGGKLNTEMRINSLGMSADKAGGHLSALAGNGDYIFCGADGKYYNTTEDIAYSSIGLLDAKTGRPALFPFGKGSIFLGEWKPSQYPGSDRPLFERIKDGDFGPCQFPENFSSLAVKGDLLAASLTLQGKVLIYNWKTGEKVREIPLQQPAGLQFDAAGGLLVAAGKDLLRIDTATGAATPLAAGQLDNPWGLALDAKGNVYVANCGKAMAVKVFSPEGKFLKQIGKPGGRAWEGPYDPNGMLMPAGITVDGEGKLWVTEEEWSPRRVSVWDTATSKLVADFQGPNHPQKNQLMNPLDPTRINVSDVEYKLDYNTGANTCLSTLYRPGLYGLRPNAGSTKQHQHAYLYRKANGREYVFLRGVYQRFGTILRPDNGRLIPIASYGNGFGLPVAYGGGIAGCGGIDATPLDISGFLTPQIAEFAYDAKQKVGTDFWQIWHTWVDRNGDGLMQPDEYLAERVPWNKACTIGFVEDDLTLWTIGRQGFTRVPVQGWTNDGIPLYPKFSETKPLFAPVTDMELSSCFWVDQTRKLVYTFDGEGNSATSKGKWAAVSCYDYTGKPQWMYRSVWPGFALDSPFWKPGVLAGASTFIGVVDVNAQLGVVGLCGYFGDYHLLSSDGLWIGHLCQDNRLGPKAGQDTQFIENFTGELYKNAQNGKVYLLGGDVDCRVWEVTGLETIKTAAQPLTISEGDNKLATEIADRRASAQGGTAAPIEMKQAAGITADGDLGEWNIDGSVSIDGGAGRTAKAMLAYDAKNLYVAYKVEDSSPMVNNGGDPTLLFKSGDTCDLMLAADPAADPKRTAAAPGDMRLQFSMLANQPVCVIFEKQARGGATAPKTYTSATGSEAFARVALLTAVKVGVKRTTSGYTLEAAIPLEEIGFKPAADLLTKADLGVLFSTEGGGRTVRRAYYANKDTSVIEDIPIESRLQPDKWAELRVK